VPGRTGNAHPNIVPYDTFATRTVPIFLAVGNNGQFRKLCQILAAPALADDPRYADNAARHAHRDLLKAELESLLADHDCVPLADTLIRGGVPCGPVLTVDEAIRHPHARHRGMIVESDGYRGTGAPVKLGRTPATYRRPPPRLGEHTREVLEDFDAGEIRPASLQEQRHAD
jgi:crotonobetainyl-CoA:carnitine CoA-transferase CaiB-like acyl-CoA transferase